MTKKIELKTINPPQDAVICNCRVCGQEKECGIELGAYGIIRVCYSCKYKDSQHLHLGIDLSDLI